MKKSMRKILVACLTLAMLMVNSLNVFAAVSGDFNIKFIFHDTDNNDQVIKEEYLTVNGTEGVAQDVDFSSIMPEGYEVDSRFTESTTVSVTPYLDGTSREVYVKKVQQTVTTLYVTYQLADGNVVDTQTVTTGATGAEGEAWTFMLGCDGYELPEGYKLAEGEEKYTTVSVPFGAASGVTLTVEPINGTVDPVKPAKETVLNITFETVDGTKVGETTAKTTATGGEGEAWTFMLGQDYQLPEGYKLAEGKDQTTNIQIPFGAVGGATIIVEPIKSDVTAKETVLNITFETVDGEVVGETTAKTTATGAEGEAWTFMLGTDYQLPEGYQLATGVDQVTNVQVPFGAMGGHVLIVEPINGTVDPVEPAKETVLNVTFETVDGEVVGTTTASTTAVGGEDEAWTFMLGEDFQLPEGYQLAEGVDQVTNIQVPFGATAGHTMIVEAVPSETVETVLNVTFETVDGEVVDTTTAKTTATGGEGEAWTFMLGTDFQLPEGYQLAEGVDQVTNIQVPFGATAGHTMIVEAVPSETVETVLNVTFETIYGEKVGETTASTTAVGGEGEAWTFMLGTDFQLPEGYQLATGVDQVTNIQIPFGAIGGHTMIVEPIPAETVETVLTITFETVDGEVVDTKTVSTTAVGGEGEAWTFMLGTDFQLPEGYQLAEGVDQVTNIQVPFGATGGHTMIVEKIQSVDPVDPVDPVEPFIYAQH